MKVIINVCYGGFSLPTKILKELSIDDRIFYYQSDKDVRTNKELIRRFEDHPEVFEDALCELKVVEVPDEATDWLINEYDGWEYIYAVVNGKLVYIG